MNFNKLTGMAAAISAMAAAVAVCLVAAAFAVYALAREFLGPAGGAAVVAGLFAVIVGVLALVLTGKVRPRSRHHEPVEEQTLMTRAILLAKERPLIAAGVAAAAVAVAIRNPGVVTALVSAAIAGRAAKPDE